ncbi:Predicted nucleic acid-binding protein, contains PIN domain [Actinopolyspora xinjiangensis]|uniref:Ribonuclease VapC n=1 Tax=Actinopolyspora xinjiangensis TaxID=405564 RepID=A0A1H0UW85_9ACTN|nr:type II toxin-antitoxin system VapC family toxin [Actinopolyspora xinjiangensis]SDP70178.1 Predicted nucleic acid-binding protein, contains PIN domain [Actinopolyspora xinjiangensis]
MIIIDASVLIAYFNAYDAHHHRAVQLLIDNAEESLAASAVTIAEILVGPARSGMLERARNALEDLEITTVPLGEQAPTRLATLRARTNLKLPDCCVVLAGEHADASTVATFDHRLAAGAVELGFAVLPDDQPTGVA